MKTCRKTFNLLILDLLSFTVVELFKPKVTKCKLYHNHNLKVFMLLILEEKCILDPCKIFPNVQAFHAAMGMFKILVFSRHKAEFTALKTKINKLTT